MAGNIKGIIVEIGGDTSGLQKALKDVNSKTASLSKELRGINSLLKLDPKNTELLAQKQTILKQNIEQTAKKLESLREAQRRFIESGGDLNSPQYRNLQREIIKTESNLKELKLEASNWTKVSRSLNEISSKMKSLGDTISSIGKTLTTKVTVPIVSLGTLATKSAIDFESAFTGVEKTVDGTAEQMAELKKGIRDMAKQIPSTTTEISAVAEAAGQLGIQTDNILGFSKAMIDLGNSTNLTADEAASQLAKFANIMQMSQKDFDKLGSAIVDLGNNYATTEADIVSMAMRLAGAGKQVGFSEGQVLGLATALSSVGIEAEMGGSAISKAMVKMQNAVKLGGGKLQNVLKKTGMSLRSLELMSSNNSKDFKALAQSIGLTSTELKNMITAGANLRDFSKVAGMSAEQFKKAWEEDASGALSAFIKGLGTAEDKGESAITLLSEMGLTEVRLRDSLLRAANAGNLFNNAIETGTKAWTENTALTNEATKRYNTLQSKIDTAKNKIQDIGITLGEIIMPYVEQFVSKISDLTQKFSNLNPKTQEMIVKIGGIIALLGPALLIIGKLISVGGTIAGVLSKVSSLIAGLTSGTGALSGVLGALTGPVGIVIAAVAALTAGIVYLFNTNEEFRAKVMEIWNSIVDLFNTTVMPAYEAIKEAVMSSLKVVWELWQNLWSKLEPLVMQMMDWLKGFWENTLKDIITNIVNFVTKAIQLWTQIYNKFIAPIVKALIEYLWPVVQRIFQGIWSVISGVFEGIGGAVKAITGIFDGLITFISGVFSGDWKKAWEGVKTIFKNIVEGLWSIIKVPLNWIIDGINGLIGGLNNLKIPDWVPGIGGKGINIPKIPRLAQGGVVDKATLAMIGEGKSAEAVIPLDRTLTKYMAEAMRQAGGNPITVNFYPQKMTEAELDRAFNYIDRRYGLAY